MNAAIRIMDASFSYGGQIIIDNVSLEIQRGELAAILGPNGGGKTTLLRCAGRSLRPRSGNIRINGRDLKEYGRRELARILAFARQSPTYPPDVIAADYAAFGRYPRLNWTGLYKKRDFEIVNSVLSELGVVRLSRRPIDTLSGGERQTFAIAQAFVQIFDAKNGVLLLDEPTSAMDWRRSLSIMRVLASKKDLAILMAMHDANLAALFATRVVGLKRGKIIFNGNTRDVFTPTNLSLLYDLDFGVFNHPDCGRPQAFPRIESRERLIE